jgi:hypothetical protein
MFDSLILRRISAVMTSQGTQLQVDFESQPEYWKLATRVAFRFSFVYFGLYCVLTQISVSLVPLPNVGIPDPATLWPLRLIVSWTAARVFRVTKPLIYSDSGSGDKTFDWVLLFCIFVIAVAATALWSILDRKRSNYIALYKWFRLAIRFCLAGQMFVYGWAKAIPLQMPYPYLARLLEPFGNFSPMGVLWASIGASPAYEVFAGCAEMLGGILLILPHTTMLGALVCLADMTQVFMLNMTYDVPVKLLSFHLILLSLFLLAPDLKRLLAFFFLNQSAGPSTQPPLFATARRNRIALVVQVFVGLMLISMNAWGSWKGWHLYGGGSPRSPLYGIWNVDDFKVDGQVRSPVLTDQERWRRVLLEIPTRMAYQRMDDSMVRYGASIDADHQTLKLTKDDDKNWTAIFSFQRPSPDRLLLDGEMDHHKIQMQLQLFDRNKLLLISRGFHWIQEYPFNR